MGCEQSFCRRQQHDNRAGRSNFEPARHGTGYGFASGRRVYYLIHDLPRIAGPSWKILLPNTTPAFPRCTLVGILRLTSQKYTDRHTVQLKYTRVLFWILDTGYLFRAVVVYRYIFAVITATRKYRQSGRRYVHEHSIQ